MPPQLEKYRPLIFVYDKLTTAHTLLAGEGHGITNCPFLDSVGFLISMRLCEPPVICTNEAF